MKPNGITWEAGGSTDETSLRSLPDELRKIIEPTGGFILHHGAIHFRGCTAAPDWNSLRLASWGGQSLSHLYPAVDVDDIPFAQDQFGDQYLLRGNEVMLLDAETGVVRKFARCLTEFMDGIEADIEGYLNVGLEHHLQPGQGFLAYPPFCVKESEGGASSFKAVPMDELIRFHADLARQIADLPDGGTLEFEMTD
ncbi:hypothetical protein OVA24_15825 [Luteolibacter sp. SL250]|uniref:hypothetical protein n=1 Tax=Luteolibacter sp. SL250 TaxID=2995170 RepID=UPI00226D6468|nr:hypothetical protein [Luteolibacter sp. SL250]WAC18698.1 hypothetical protein OVA24_15825 [Luteolibacter sp. SL250]